MKPKATSKNPQRKTAGKLPATEPTALTIAARLPRIKGKTPGERINFLHQLSVASGKLSIVAAILAGWELLQIHGAIPHGEWLSWLQKHTALSEATARRYMAVYASTLGVARAALPKPKPPTEAPSQEELQEACANVEASSITGLYQQLQLLKRNANHGGPREGAGRKAKGSVGEQLDAALRSAELAWLATAEHLDALEALFPDLDAVARLNDERLSRLFSALSPICTAASRQLEARAKGNGRRLSELYPADPGRDPYASATVPVL